MTARSFWPPAEASQVDYETLRAHLLEHGRLPDGLAAARFARRGMAGLIAWPAAEPVFVAELFGAARPAWTPHADPAAVGAGRGLPVPARRRRLAAGGVQHAEGCAVKVALYARVSTERQAERGTIGSQLAALRGAGQRGRASSWSASSSMTGTPGPGWTGPAWTRCATPPRPACSSAVWCLSPDRLARVYAYQVLVLDELARFGVAVHFTDAPDFAPDDPQATLLTQVQGVIAEYEKAKIAERYRRGKLFRARAGEITTWKTPYGYRRVARSAATGPAHLEIYEPEAAVVRRIFTDRAAGTTVRQICRRLNADQRAVPDREADLAALHPVAGCCATRPMSAGSTSTAPSRCPTGGRAAAAVRCHVTAPTGSRSHARASSPTTCSRPPDGSRSTTPNGAPAGPNPASGC